MKMILYLELYSIYVEKEIIEKAIARYLNIDLRVVDIVVRKKTDFNKD